MAAAKENAGTHPSSPCYMTLLRLDTPHVKDGGQGSADPCRKDVEEEHAKLRRDGRMIGWGTVIMEARSPDELDIQDFVLRFLHQQYYSPAPDGPPDLITVMMAGIAESLSDGKVWRATKLVIKALGAEAIISEDSPSFKAARGAVELAQRALKADGRSEL